MTTVVAPDGNTYEYVKNNKTCKQGCVCHLTNNQDEELCKFLGSTKNCSHDHNWILFKEKIDPIVAHYTKAEVDELLKAQNATIANLIKELSDMKFNIEKLKYESNSI